MGGTCGDVTQTQPVITVEWSTCPGVSCVVSPHQIQKPADAMVFRVGDVVAALENMVLHGRLDGALHLVVEGDGGTVTGCRPLRVEWLRCSGSVVVEPHQVEKCSPTDYMRVGDVVKAKS